MSIPRIGLAARVLIAIAAPVCIGAVCPLQSAQSEAIHAQSRAAEELFALTTLQRAIEESSASSVVSIESACERLRVGPPQPFEREWMLASAALLARAGSIFGRPESAAAHIEHALSRFPDDARLRLGRILVRPEAYTTSNVPNASDDNLSKSFGRGLIRGTFLRSPRAVKQTVADLEHLAADPIIGDEARAHLALLQFLRGDLDQSLLHARIVGGDPFTRNLAGLVAGLAFDAKGKRSDATRAYQAAVDALPTAKGAATALAAHLFLDGRRGDAGRVLGRAYRAADVDSVDPWLSPNGDYRFIANYLTRMYEILGREPTIKSLPTGAALGPLSLGTVANANHGTPASPTTQESLTFRQTSSAVAVDVSIRRNKRPVIGLTAADFALFDNGVAQAIDAVSIGAVPLDVSLVMDTSEPWLFAADGKRDASHQAVSDILDIATLLRPVDRLRVITANILPAEILSWRQMDRPLDRDSIRWNVSFPAHNEPTAALYDATARALIEPSPGTRRNLVVVFTDGIDGTSVLTGGLLTGIARESDATMHVVRHQTECERVKARNPRSSCSDSKFLLVPADTAIIESAARATAGSVRRVKDTDSSVDMFRQILDEFRQSYILYYQPKRVPPDGWHRVDIRIKIPGNVEVRARRGYFGG